MPYLKQAIIKYKKTTLSIKYYLLERYALQLFNDGDNNRRRDYYAENKKAINKKIRTELDTKIIDKNVSQYVEYWLYHSLEEIRMKDLSKCEERNKSQREALKEKYSILEKDVLLKKIDCLEWKVEKLKHPENAKKEIERYNKNNGTNITYKDEIVNCQVSPRCTISKAIS